MPVLMLVSGVMFKKSLIFSRRVKPVLQLQVLTHSDQGGFYLGFPEFLPLHQSSPGIYFHRAEKG
jgi:hypothetical protein